MTVHALVDALRRRWRLWAATSLVGLLTALAFSLVSPPAYSATTTLLLHHPAQFDPSRAMANDAELLRTRTVAQTTVDSLGLPLSGKDFISEYTVTPLSDELLRITVNGPTNREAIRRADGLAQAFLDFRREVIERDLEVAVARLERERRTITGELEAVDQELINLSTGNSAAAGRESGELVARRAALNDRLGALEAQIQAIARNASDIVDRSSVVDPASEDDRSPVMAALVNLAAGLVAGLSLGAGWIVVQEVAFDRVRRREEIVATLRAPISVSVGPIGGPLWLQRRRFRQQQKKRERDVAKVVDHLRASLPHSGTFEPGLVVVSVDSNRPAALAVALTAVDLTKEGTSVLVVDLTNDSSLARLFGVPPENTSTLRQDGASGLTLAFPYSNSDNNIVDLRQQEREKADQSDVILVLANLHPDIGAGHLKYWATRVVAVVTAGRSTPTALRSASQLLQVSGLEIASTVLVGADPHDDSLGIVYQPSPSAELRAFWAATDSVAKPANTEGGLEGSPNGGPAPVFPASSVPDELGNSTDNSSSEHPSLPPSPDPPPADPIGKDHNTNDDPTVRRPPLWQKGME
ncbi:MAG TPA: Wzz/FepE/Etk N-terminal domain-containing protein [Acidimicrobiales bacterium]|nr:Wzz/FepE/Etk N-terminal domain-containing protein [Acidimicrobiales bacterium]